MWKMECEMTFFGMIVNEAMKMLQVWNVTVSQKKHLRSILIE